MSEMRKYVWYSDDLLEALNGLGFVHFRSKVSVETGAKTSTILFQGTRYTVRSGEVEARIDELLSPKPFDKNFSLDGSV